VFFGQTDIQGYPATLFPFVEPPQKDLAVRRMVVGLP
jgi:hypothetical protein